MNPENFVDINSMISSPTNSTPIWWQSQFPQSNTVTDSLVESVVEWSFPQNMTFLTAEMEQSSDWIDVDKG